MSSPSLRPSWVGGCWLVGEIGLVGGSVTPEPLRRGGWVGLGDSPQSAMVGQFSQITSLHFSQYDFNTDS